MAFRTFQAIVVALLAVGTSAQFVGLPACAQGCVDISVGPSGCAATDLACLCASRPFLSSTQRCIATACGPDEGAQADASLVNSCDSATGTGPSTSNPPATTSGTSTTGSGTGTGTPTNTGTTTGTGTSTGIPTSTGTTTSPTTVLPTSTETTAVTIPTTSITVAPPPPTTTIQNTGTSVPSLSSLTMSPKPTTNLSSSTGSPVQTGSGGNGAIATDLNGLSVFLGVVAAWLFAL
ncbi:hypothetical protein PQX77_002106 [Marasmius sp. AFHP31]|nr:hypothetical protein PQX77_002106 [Marasmius sp. AFHP31]